MDQTTGSSTFDLLAQATDPGRTPSGFIRPLEESSLPVLPGPAETEAAIEQITDPTWLQLFHQYIGVFVVAFMVSVLLTPVMRRIAVANGVIDRPSEARKVHKIPVAYLGGVAVYLGILAGVVFSYLALLRPELMELHTADADPVPISILAGMTAITVIGVVDDIVGISPRIKIGGQLFAAALLAFNDIGVKVATGLLKPLGRRLDNENLVYGFDLPDWMSWASVVFGDHIQVDVIYWTGTAIIAVFVIGACNASNLIDGLDGLLSGVTAIAMVGLLAIALALGAANDGKLDAARIVLCMAVLGACLGFLPHNFNPASIFLGDAGSMLLGFMTIVAILSLGDTGRTHLVIAGLLIYSVPIIDTTLAIIRRKMAGLPLSAADDQHLHHQLKRALGVKGAVLAMYGIAAIFAFLGVAVSMGRGRVIYAIALVVGAFIVVTAIKQASRARIEADASRSHLKRGAGPAAPSTPAATTAREPEPVRS